MNNNTGIKVFAPACISMLSYGLKDVSMALEKPGNEIIAHIDENNKGVVFDIFSKEKYDRNNIKSAVEIILRNFLEEINTKFGIKLSIFNKISFSAGLGALEANITGSIIAINQVLKSNFDNQDVFEFIIESANKNNIEILPSNVAAVLFGGIVFYNNNLHKNIQKLYVPHGMNLTIIDKPNKINKNVFDNISKDDLFKQSINNASFIKSLFETDHDLLSNSLRYNVFESKLAQNIEWYSHIKETSYSNGVYAIGFSHYGESIFILNPNTLISEENNKAIGKYFDSVGIKYKLINTEINLNGIYKF